MFTIDSDKTINVTRGDILYFSVSAKDSESGVKYTFQAGDIVRMNVYGKKECENVVLKKDFAVTTPCEEIEIYLDKVDTKIGETINKATDFWYEIVLNPDVKPQTIIGFDDEGAKIFKLYPEGEDTKEDENESTDEFNDIDDELNLLSERPVKNSAIARAVAALTERIEALESKVELLTSAKEETATVTYEEGETE